MPKKLTDARRVEIEREVITCLYRVLYASEPQIPVRREFVGECEEVLDCLLEERPLSAYFGKWALIFESINWADSKRSTGPRYGLRLLQFLGHLGEALREGGDTAISRTAAIELLMEFQEGTDLHFRYGHSDEDHWRIETTPEGERVIGFPVKLDLPEAPLTRSYSAPQELFNHVFDLVRSA